MLTELQNSIAVFINDGVGKTYDLINQNKYLNKSITKDQVCLNVKVGIFNLAALCAITTCMIAIFGGKKNTSSLVLSSVIALTIRYCTGLAIDQSFKGRAQKVHGLMRRSSNISGQPYLGFFRAFAF
jgi:hypothetical protein